MKIERKFWLLTIEDRFEDKSIRRRKMFLNVKKKIFY